MKHNIILSKQTKTVSGTVQLTGSKSECNRALIIEALSKGKVKVENMSDAADAVTLKNILYFVNNPPRIGAIVVTKVATMFSTDGSTTETTSQEVILSDGNSEPSKTQVKASKSEVNVGPAG